MKKYITLGWFIMSYLVAAPYIVSAHETRMYEINGKSYQFVVGSLNEPVAVDDKTGAYIKVTLPASSGQKADTTAVAAEGLEKTFKVEVSAGNKKKTMDLTPIHGEAGAYRASFIPTVQTTFTYRFFGTIDATPIDVSFACNPAGHPVTPEDSTSVELSPAVKQTLKRGAFGCPAAKADLGFPEAAITLNDLNAKADNSAALLAAKKTRTTDPIAMALGAVGVLLAIAALAKSKKAV